jgi:acyl-CoA thioesterase
VSAAAATAFDRAATTAPLGDGAHAVTLDPAWDAPAGPNGGYLAALVLAAMQAELAGAARPPRSLTLHFLRPGAPGEATVHVTREREGRTFSSLSARVVQGDRLLLLALAAFGDEGEGVVEYAAAAPVAPPLDEVRPVEVPVALVPIAAFFEFRPVFGALPFSGAPEAQTGGWLRLREERPLDALLLAVSTDAWWPVPFLRVSAPLPAPTIDLTIHFRAAPPPDPGTPVLTRFTSRTAHGGFFEEDGELWAPDGTLLAQSRQLALARPLRGPQPARGASAR